MTFLNPFNHFNDFKSDGITDQLNHFKSNEIIQSIHITCNLWPVDIIWNDSINLLNSHQMKLFKSLTHFIHVSLNESIQSMQSEHSIRSVEIIWSRSMISFRRISSRHMNRRQSVHIKWNNSIRLMISMNLDQMKSSNQFKSYQRPQSVHMSRYSSTSIKSRQMRSLNQCNQCIPGTSEKFVWSS
jgi:hypothetical protein